MLRFMPHDRDQPAPKPGIEELMDDLGAAMASGSGMRFLGGGQPAHIPPMAERWRMEMRRLLDEDPAQFDSMVGVYDGPGGSLSFRTALAETLSKRFGWRIGPENVAVTNGGQTAFYFLFQQLAARVGKKILLPLCPEYIGYADQGFGEDLFRAVPPAIERDANGGVGFKYRVDFERLELADDVGAICVSRPTNPTGNVLTENELDRLWQMAREKNVPLLVDNAYGVPFPGIVYDDEAVPFWRDEGVVLTYSLSKLGLPGTRTGIVIGPPEIVAQVSSMTAVVGLANGNVGQVLVRDLVATGEIIDLCAREVRPYYQERCLKARAALNRSLRGTDYLLHRSEGAMFLWLRIPGLPITSRELYERLKAEGVLVVPGEYFYFGLPEPIAEQTECLRISYSQDERTVAEGLEIIGKVIRSL